MQPQKGDDLQDGLENHVSGNEDHLRAKLARYRRDLEQARNELAEARQIQESLSEQLHGAVDRASGAVPPSRARSSRRRGWRRVWRRLRMSPERRALEGDVCRLCESTWFDANWYLAEYPDVGNAGVGPAEHYLRFGVQEGRNPGPSFSTSQYLRDHPDLIGTGVNPLLHYLQHAGQAGAQ